jgi:uncharacterized membrane protein SirB2
MYETLKLIHISTAVLSFSGFIVRGVWMMQSSQRLNLAWVKIVPHVNDTILLVSASILSVMSQQYPVSTAWINAKLLALIAYIVLGSIALKRGKDLGMRVIAWGIAVFVFVYILGVAITKNPMIIF